MISNRHGAALILVALASCAERAGDVAAAAPPADQCFSLAASQAVDLTAGGTLRVGSGGRIFELELSGDCGGSGGPPIAIIESGSPSPVCAGEPRGREIVVRHPMTQQSNICRVEAVRLAGFDPAG